MASVAQIVHIEPALHLAAEGAPADGGSGGWLDICTRCTYNLLVAAVAAGVGRLTLCGSIDVFLPYDVRHGVMPDW